MTRSSMIPETTIGIDSAIRRATSACSSLTVKCKNELKCQRQWLRSGAALSPASRCASPSRQAASPAGSVSS